jgi:hypothetical protein
MAGQGKIACARRLDLLYNTIGNGAGARSTTAGHFVQPGCLEVQMNALFLVTFFVTVLFGLGLALIPGLLLGVFGVSLDAVAVTLARLFGSALLGLPILLWFGRITRSRVLRKGLVFSMFIYFLASLVVLVLAMLAGQMNVLGWSLVGLHALLMVWFGYFLGKR